MVDSFVLSKTVALWSAMFMRVTSKQYVTDWATLLPKSGTSRHRHLISRQSICCCDTRNSAAILEW